MKRLVVQFNAPAAFCPGAFADELGFESWEEVETYAPGIMNPGL